MSGRYLRVQVTSSVSLAQPSESQVLDVQKLRLKIFLSLWQNTESMDAKTFFRELRRRNVYKVAIAYLVLAWLLTEATSVLLFGHEERTSLMRALAVIVAVGFVVALYISWAFEATPEGMKRTKDVPIDAVLPTWSQRKFTIFIVAVAIFAASLHVLDLVRSGTKPGSPPPTAAP
jgi:adenylate cyclase